MNTGSYEYERAIRDSENFNRGVDHYIERRTNEELLKPTDASRPTDPRSVENESR